MFENFLNETVRWLTQPQTVFSIVTFLFGLPKLIETFKTAKGSNLWDKALEVAKIEAEKIVKETLSDSEKKKRVVKTIIYVIPEITKYLTKEQLEEIAEIAYRTFVKPNFK